MGTNASSSLSIMTSLCVPMTSSLAHDGRWISPRGLPPPCEIMVVEKHGPGDTWAPVRSSELSTSSRHHLRSFSIEACAFCSFFSFGSAFSWEFSEKKRFCRCRQRAFVKVIHGDSFMIRGESDSIFMKKYEQTDIVSNHRLKKFVLFVFCT